MPNPRNNTVVLPNNLESAINSARQGRLEIRMDRHANLHARIGKRSFTEEQLLNNLAAVYETITRANRRRQRTIRQDRIPLLRHGPELQSKPPQFGKPHRIRLK